MPVPTVQSVVGKKVAVGNEGPGYVVVPGVGLSVAVKATVNCTVFASLTKTVLLPE
jgi:hypothetical protein